MMGVERADFIVIGADIGYDKYDDERFEEYEEFYRRNHIGEMTYILDGMSGQYFIVGEVVRYGDYYDGFGVHEIAANEESSKRAAEFIRNKFGIEVEPSLMVVTHFY